MTDIRGFYGQYSFLSNFHPVTFVMDEVEYPSSEHAYMCAKTHSSEWKGMILSAKTPGVAKRIGRKAPLRKDWDEGYKNHAMMRVLIHKFSLPEMNALLMATGDSYLEETNTWGDKYWGVCEDEGKNMLGRMLMFLRDYYEFKN